MSTPETAPVSVQDVRLTSLSHGGGCACKLGSTELADVLSHLTVRSDDPAVLLGLDQPDDAAVYRVAPGLGLVQTVDFFTPIVDDPFDWGRIAATNALSDVYAMGGKPATALNLVAWPRALDLELLGRVLQGGAAVCDEAGATIVGGHSIDDPEPKYGLAVTGIVHPDEVVRTRGAPAGADLVLTKPIGVGIISSGIKSGQTSDAAAAEAVRVMTTLNRGASQAMTEVGVHAATDVTGFGLIGHLSEMLDGRVSARIDLDVVPIMLEAVELVLQGVFPGGSRRNLEAMIERVHPSDDDDPRVPVLFDAQTSGGLLIAVAPEKTADLHAALADRGVSGAATIGSIVDGEGHVRVESG